VFMAGTTHRCDATALVAYRTELREEASRRGRLLRAVFASRHWVPFLSMLRCGEREKLR
jgi:hypothetical protein